MHVLVVICHPKQDSSTHTIADQVIKGAESREHTTKVLDLYRDGFHPVFTPRDWEQFEEVPMPEDVLEQQRFIEESDAHFPCLPNLVVSDACHVERMAGSSLVSRLVLQIGAQP